MMSGLKTLSSKLPDAPPMLIATSLPKHLRAQHGHRLALGRVDLARHDRAAGLVLGDAQLADAAARARRQPAHVVGDLHQRRGQRLERAVGVHQRVVGGERLELVGRGHERQPGQLRQLGGDAAGELGVRVEAGADGGAAERQLAEVRQRRLDVRRGRDRAAPPSREISWPSVSGVASCRCVRPILTMSANAAAFFASVSRSFCTDGSSVLGQRGDGGDVHRRREDVVRRLALVDVVVGVQLATLAALAAHELASRGWRAPRSCSC